MSGCHQRLVKLRNLHDYSLLDRFTPKGQPMDANEPIIASRDMIQPLEDDVLLEWEAFFIQVQNDFDDAIESIRDEYNNLRWEAGEPGYSYGSKRPSQARMKAARRQAELARESYLQPTAKLAVRL